MDAKNMSLDDLIKRDRQNKGRGGRGGRPFGRGGRGGRGGQAFDRQRPSSDNF